MDKLKEYLTVGKILWTIFIFLAGGAIGIYIQLQISMHDIDQLDETLGLVRVNQVRIENKIDQIIMNNMGAKQVTKSKEIK